MCVPPLPPSFSTSPALLLPPSSGPLCQEDGGTWKSSESSVLYWLESVSECSPHHCSSLKQPAESKSLASS